MRHPRLPDGFDRLSLAAMALVFMAALLADGTARATSCGAPNIMLLNLESVTEDGVPIIGNYDASVTLHSREAGVVEVTAHSNIRAGVWSESYRVAPSPAP
jgi:hypothetical protein